MHAFQSLFGAVGATRKKMISLGVFALLAALAGCSFLTDGISTIGGGAAQKPAGLYYTSVPANGFCYWARLRNTSGEFSGIIESGTGTSGRQYVQILPTDRAFHSRGCSLWLTPKPTSYNPNRATAKAGDYRIPTDLLPGTYTAPGGPFCYWARLSGWTGALTQIIANGGFEPHQVMTISSTDAGFSSESCGTWTRIGP